MIVVERRPDGDLTVAGTNVWMPASIAEIRKELNEVERRRNHLLAGERFLLNAAYEASSL